ncbi:MAG: DinB family protein [Planctomycetes bacterium]|nr:DinB family protein [Planctomycetota bacterium]
MKYVDILKQDAEGAYHAAAGLFKLVDEGALDWKPETGKNWMNVGQLLKHCSEACGSTVKGFVTGDWGFPTDAPPEDTPADAMMPPAESMATVNSVEEALKLLEADKKLAFEMFEKAGEERLITQKSAPPWGGPERTLYQHCHEMIGHLAQHKGQLFYYLKLQGKDVNTMHLWGAGPS